MGVAGHDPVEVGGDEARGRDRKFLGDLDLERPGLNKLRVIAGAQRQEIENVERQLRLATGSELSQ